MRCPAQDELREAWSAGDYLTAQTLLENKVAIRASTCRRILAPRLFWERLCGLPTPKKGEKPHFSRALALLASKLPEALKDRPDILGQMRANGSLRMLAHVLGRSCVRFMPDAASLSEPWLFEEALFRVLSLMPSSASAPSISCSISGAKPSFHIAENPEPFWTGALALPEQAARRLLSLAALDGPLEPSAAWSAVESGVQRGRKPGSIRAMLERARAPSAMDVQAMATKIALEAMDSRSGESIQEWLEALRELCERHADLGGALSCEAIIGSAARGEDHGKSRHAKLYSLIRPQAFDRRGSGRDLGESARALRFLAWLDGCALICAELGLCDIDASVALDNPRLENAYSTLGLAVCEGRMQGLAGEGFPLGAARLAEAFNARKLALGLQAKLPQGSLPTRPKSI